MKKIIICIITILILFQGLTPFAEGFGKQKQYNGIMGYMGIKNNIKYKDIDKSFAKEDIIKLKALDIINDNGEKFNPKSTISRRQALVYMARAMGIYEEDSAFEIIDLEELDKITTLTKEQLEKIEKDMKTIEEKYKEKGNELTSEEKQRIQDKEIEKLTWGVSVTREEISLWMARILDLEYGNTYSARSYKDSKDFKEIHKNIISSIIQNNYMIGYPNNDFRPKANITKEEFAKVMGNTLDDILKKRGYNIKRGKIYEKKEIIFFNNTGEEKNIYIHIQNLDNTYSTITITKGTSLREDKGFIIYNKGKIDISHNINKGSHIKYYIDKDDNIIYAEVE